jgi:glycosyltransferase involved in cell wall biosynthesis
MGVRSSCGDENVCDSAQLPLVTAIIPAFNAEATIAETLRSVAAQTWPNLEILIVDDGSTDRTAAIAEAFCAGEKRARLLRKPNDGVASARNLGLREALGAWAAPIDADDLWHPAKIEKQVAAALAKTEPPGLVYCWYRTIDGAGRVTGSGVPGALDGRAPARLLWRNVIGNGSSPLLATAAALEVGGYEERLRAGGAEGCEDVLLALRIAARHPIETVPEYLVGYRVGRDRMSSDPERMFRSWRAALDILRGHKEVPPGAARAARWNLAERSFGLAEARAIRGNRAGAAAMLARALRLDPARTGLNLGYRIARFLARAARRRGAAPEPAPFLDQDPAAPTPALDDPHALPGLARWIAAFDARRLRRLEMQDREEGLRSDGPILKSNTC